jgi:beta-lactamase class A
MIVRSSNLATNLLIERLDPTRVTATIRRLGADSMLVLRGVEDGKAYAKGLNNTTTARDLGTLLQALAGGPQDRVDHRNLARRGAGVSRRRARMPGRKP